jgi:hypothetical protein
MLMIAASGRIVKERQKTAILYSPVSGFLALDVEAFSGR